MITQRRRPVRTALEQVIERALGEGREGVVDTRMVGGFLDRRTLPVRTAHVPEFHAHNEQSSSARSALAWHGAAVERHSRRCERCLCSLATDEQLEREQPLGNHHDGHTVRLDSVPPGQQVLVGHRKPVAEGTGTLGLRELGPCETVIFELTKTPNRYRGSSAALGRTRQEGGSERAGSRRKGRGVPTCAP